MNFLRRKMSITTKTASFIAIIIFLFCYEKLERSFSSSRLLQSQGVGKHKDLFPMNIRDYVGTFLVIIGLIIAASGGIGGGGILVPLLILVFEFKAKLAIPLSNFTIFGGSITNMILNIPKRHPEVDRPLVDWSLITIMQPLTLAGAIIGAYLGRLFPDWILDISLVTVLGYTSIRTLEKGISQYKKETLSQVGGVGGIKNSKTSGLVMKNVIQEELENIEKEEKMSLLGEDEGSLSSQNAVRANKPNYQSIYTDKSVIDDADDLLVECTREDDNPTTNNVNEKHQYQLQNRKDRRQKTKQEVLAEIIESERNIPIMKVVWISGMFIVVILLNLVKGGNQGSFQSPLGIQCGSYGYWGLTVLNLIWILIVSVIMRNILLNEWKLKDRIHYKYIDTDIEWTPINTIIYPLLCIFAGLVAGMFGVGGGIVFGPMMLEMGIHPMVASATSAVMIFFTSVVASSSYIVFGTLTYDYAVYLFCWGLVATAFGQIVVGYFINKHKRFSLISLSIGIVVLLSALLMAVESLVEIFMTEAAGTQVGEDDTNIC